MITIDFEEGFLVLVLETEKDWKVMSEHLGGLGKKRADRIKVPLCVLWGARVECVQDCYRITGKGLKHLEKLKRRQ